MQDFVLRGWSAARAAKPPNQPESEAPATPAVERVSNSRR
jgi:hypothetical protein